MRTAEPPGGRGTWMYRVNPALSASFSSRGFAAAPRHGDTAESLEFRQRRDRRNVYGGPVGPSRR